MTEKPDLPLCNQFVGQGGQTWGHHSVLVCGSHGYRGVQDTFSIWYLQRFPGFRLPWVSLISLNESLKLYEDTGIFFFFPPWHSGTQSVERPPPIPIQCQQPNQYPCSCRALFYCCKSAVKLLKLPSLPFPLSSAALAGEVWQSILGLRRKRLKSRYSMPPKV